MLWEGSIIRPSSYNIYVKLHQPDSYLIVQGCTGAVDKVNESVYRYLNDKDLRGDLSSSEIDKLAKRGYLTERSVDEERQYLKRIAEIYYRRASTFPNFMFAPTFSCQLRCPYCFESHITHKDDAASLKTMTSEHVGRAYAAMDKIIEGQKKSPGKKGTNRITLYGGEPLMAINYQIVREIVDEGVNRKYTFDAITNGYDLLKYEDLLGPGKIDTMQITLDGPEHVHNKRRFGKNGSPTFNNIVAGIQLALDKGCKVNCRTNVDVTNISSFTELNRLYIEKGWNKYSNFYPYAYAVKGVSQRVLLPMELLASLYDSSYHPKDANNVIHIDFGVETIFNSLLWSKKVPSLRSYFCSSNLGNYIFGPDEYIYACWDEVGLEDGRIGKYMPELIWYEERLREWHERTIYNIRECLNCKYALLCGGGCGRQAKVTNGSLHTPYCHQFDETFHYIVPAVYEKHIRKIEERKLSDDKKLSDVCA